MLCALQCGQCVSVPHSVLALSVASSASWSNSVGVSDAKVDFVQQRLDPELTCECMRWHGAGHLPPAERGFPVPRLLKCAEFHQYGFGLQLQ